MKFSEYISRHQVFTTAELLRECDSAESAEEQLRLAVRSGSVERVRRGLLVSNFRRFEGEPVDPLAVVIAADEDAIVSFHSACEAHGVAHNVGFVCQFRSDSIRKAFTFRGVEYRPCGTVDGVQVKPMRLGASRVRVTTREQTIVDCLDRPRLAGGIEEAVRNISAFAYVDAAALMDIVCARGAQTASRVGWLLSEKREDWHIDDGVFGELQEAIGPGPYRLGRPGPSRKGWSREWRLLLPDSNEEVSAWITRG